MGDFVNYTPGEYAKEHIRITPTTLADGRDFFYLDDDPEYVSGVKTRELKDPRQLPYRFSNQLNAAGEEVPYAAPEMRRDPLTGDWIPMATARMNRPITAGPGATAKGNPLAARKPGDPYQDGEVPDTDYNVVVFENRFPSMVRVPGRSEAVEYVNGNPLWEKKLAVGRCEVICFDPDEDGLPADLPVSPPAHRRGGMGVPYRRNLQDGGYRADLPVREPRSGNRRLPGAPARPGLLLSVHRTEDGSRTQADRSLP